jgi:hypothetical protein
MHSPHFVQLNLALIYLPNSSNSYQRGYQRDEETPMTSEVLATSAT